MAMIFNWPDRCPSCETTKFFPFKPNPKDREDRPMDHEQWFACENCEAQWREILVPSTRFPCWIVSSPAGWFAPSAILARRLEHVKKLLSVKEGQYVICRLEEALERGDKQVLPAAKEPEEPVEGLWTPNSKTEDPEKSNNPESSGPSPAS